MGRENQRRKAKGTDKRGRSVKEKGEKSWEKMEEDQEKPSPNYETTWYENQTESYISF